MSEDNYGVWKWRKDHSYNTTTMPYSPEKTASLVILNDQDSYGGNNNDVIEH